jgi:MYXO-CTERM domain-containing protein
MGCANNNECASDLCVPQGDERVCAVRCGAGGSCEDGFSCAATGNVCLPAKGGCAVGGGGAGGAGWLALLAAALLVPRRRRG